ncbi:MAG: oxygenase MpaB family protein [Pseudonocardia sp.]
MSAAPAEPPAVPPPPRASRPGSLLWELVGDWRLIMVMPGSMVMQVAHPVVGAGVGEHSVFRTDPWGRLLHSLDSTLTLIYGGAGALAEGRRLQEVHREIRGVDADGRRYSALNPEAYAWVHLILYERLVTMSRLLGPPLSGDDRVRLYAEMLELGRVLHIRPQHMPATEAEFWPYLDKTVSDRLEHHPTVDAFLDVLRRSDVPPPRWPGRLDRAWPPIGRRFGAMGHFLAVGSLSPQLRDLLGLSWTDRQERMLRRMGDGIARTAPRLPERWRYFPAAARARAAARR